MPAMKRPAAAAPVVARVSKKPATGNAPKREPFAQDGGVNKKVILVASALQQAELPETVRNMLTAVLPHTLGTVSGQRHGYQQQLVMMAGEALNGVAKAMQEQLEQVDAILQAKTEASNTLSNEADVSQKKVEEAEGVVSAQKAEFDAAEVAVQEAKKTAVGARKAHAGAEAEAANEEKKQIKVESLLDRLEAYIAGSLEAKDSVAVAKELQVVGAEFGYDSDILSSLATAISKSDRGTFAQMMTQQLRGSLQQSLAQVQTNLAATEPLKAERQAAVSEATEAQERAEAKKASVSEELEKARLAQKAAQDEQKALQKSLKENKRDLKDAEKSCKDVRSGFQAFAEAPDGPIAMFKELESRTAEVSTPPESEILVEEPAPQAAAMAEP